MKIQHEDQRKHPCPETASQVVMSQEEAIALVKEMKPYIKGMVVGEHPKIERLARLVGIDLGTVS